MSISSLGGSPVATFIHIAGNETRAAQKAQKASASETSALAHFTAATKTLTSPAALLKDYKTLQVVLSAYGMSNQINATAVLSKLMTQDPTSATSLARTSGNAAWQTFASAMSSWKPTPFTASVVSNITQGYVLAQYENQQQDASPGLGDALYYARNASSVKSVSQLMADSRLLNVTLIMHGVNPTQYGALDYTLQKQMVTKMVNLSDFKSTSTINRNAERYLCMLQTNPDWAPTAPSAGSANPLLTLFNSSGGANSLTALAAGALSFSA
jgi:Protein of unknown function (DUF1217)